MSTGNMQLATGNRQRTINKDIKAEPARLSAEGYGRPVNGRRYHD